MADKLFLDSYKERQLAVKSNTSPVIVVNFSSLILYWNGFMETNQAIPDIYHALKVIDHIPFGIFLCIQPYSAQSHEARGLPKGTVEELKKYQAVIEATEKALPDAGFLRINWLVSAGF